MWFPVCGLGPEQNPDEERDRDEEGQGAGDRYDHGDGDSDSDETAKECEHYAIGAFGKY